MGSPDRSSELFRAFTLTLPLTSRCAWDYSNFYPLVGTLGADDQRLRRENEIPDGAISVGLGIDDKAKRPICDPTGGLLDN